MDQQGYFLSAIGHEHLLMAHNFAITLKCQGDMRPVCVLVKPEHVPFARDLEGIDFIISFSEQEDYGVLTDHEKYCGMAKIDFHDKIPLDQYIMVDADFLAVAPTEHVWKFLSTITQPVVNFGTIDAPFWHWNELPNIEKKTGLKLSYTCGDIVYFNKSHSDFKSFIARVRKIFLDQYDEYGCKRLFGPFKSKTEEVAFSIAASEKGYSPIQMHEFPIINYNPKIGQSYKDFSYPFEPVTHLNQTFIIPPPFVHLWDKLFGLNYQRVWFETINGFTRDDTCVFVKSENDAKLLS